MSKDNLEEDIRLFTCCFVAQKADYRVLNCKVWGVLHVGDPMFVNTHNSFRLCCTEKVRDGYVMLCLYTIRI